MRVGGADFSAFPTLLLAPTPGKIMENSFSVVRSFAETRPARQCCASTPARTWGRELGLERLLAGLDKKGIAWGPLPGRRRL